MINITFYIHGTTTDNEQGIARGSNQGVLSDLGIEQSIKLANTVKDEVFDAVYTSDLDRAVDSVDYVFGDKFTVVQDKRLRECDYGVHTGKPAKSFKADRSLFIDDKFEGGESYRDVEARVRSLLTDIASSYDDGARIAIVGHQAPQLAIEVICKNLTWEQAFDQDWRNDHSWQPGWEYKFES